MSDSTGIAVAKAIETFLKAEQFEIPIAPEWSLADWDLKLEDANNLHVDIVPANTPTLELQNQSRAKFEGQVDISVRKRFERQERDECGRVDREEVARLMLLTESIALRLMKQRMSSQEAVWNAVAVQWNPNKDHLRQFKQFSSWIRVSFITTQALP